MNNVSIYVILNTKNSSLNTHFVFFCLLYLPAGVFFVPAVVSQHIWTPFSTAHLSHLGNVLMEFLPFSSEMLPIFQEKIQVGT